MSTASRPRRPLARRPRSRGRQTLWSVGLLFLVLHLLVGVPGLLDDGCPGCDNHGLIQIEAGPLLLLPCLSSWPCETGKAICQHSGHRLRPSARAPPVASLLAAV